MVKERANTTFYIFKDDNNFGNNSIIIIEDYNTESALKRFQGTMQSGNTSALFTPDYPTRHYPYHDFYQDIRNANSLWSYSYTRPVNIYKAITRENVQQWAQKTSNKEKTPLTLVFYLVSKKRETEKITPQNNKKKNTENTERKVNTGYNGYTENTGHNERKVNTERTENSTSENPIINGITDLFSFFDGLSNSQGRSEDKVKDKTENGGHKSYKIPTSPLVSEDNKVKSEDKADNTSVRSIDSLFDAVFNTIEDKLKQDENVPEEDTQIPSAFDEFVKTASRDDIKDYLNELIIEREDINEAITTLETLLEADDSYHQMSANHGTIFPIEKFLSDK